MTEKLFTQEEVNQIVRERLAQEKGKAAAALKEREAEWKAQAEKDTEAVRRELESLKAEKQHNVLISALEKAHAINPAEISKLIEARVKTDADGNITMDGPDGKPVPVEKGVNDYMAANLWAMKNMASGGAGSGGIKVNGTVEDTALRRAFDI